MGSSEHKRPGRDEYYMRIAMAVRARANCVGNRVGAVLVLGDRVISTGYNGTPADMTNCEDGGCERCNNREKYPSGQFYDKCICVHAEQNALLAAARFGIGVEGSALYCTMKPCFSCAKQLIQARVAGINFLHDWQPTEEFRAEYEKLLARFTGGVRKIAIEDPDEVWAVSSLRNT